MNKKQKNIALIVIIAIILIGILAYTGKLPFAISGFSALSLGQVNFDSNDPTIGGQAWLLTVSQNGAGQLATGEFTATDSKGAKSDKFTIETFIDKNYAIYGINNQNDYLQHIDYTVATYNPFASFGGCNPDVWDYYYHPSEFAILSNVYCYKFSNSGVYGTITAPSNNFQSTISVSGSGGSDSCTVSNVKETSCSSSQGKVIVNWVGNLVSGQALPYASDQNLIAIYNTAKGGWITADKTAFDDWKIKKSNINKCIADYKSTSCFTDLNNQESKVLAGKSLTTIGGEVASTSGSQYNGQLTLKLPTQIQFPVLTMRIKASLIGIYIPVGMPQITYIKSSSFQTGQTGTIQVTVKNVGTASGNFDVSSTCSNGFVQEGNSLRISGLSSGSSQTVYLPIRANVVSGNLQGSCVVKVNDVGNPNNVVSKTVSVSSSAISICSQGELRISGNGIEECKNNVWVLTKTCSSTETAKYVGATPQCVTNSGSGGGGSSNGECAWYDLPCKISKFFSALNSLLNLVKYIVILGLTLFSFIYGREFLDKIIKKHNKQNTIIILIISLLFAGAVAVILYTVLLTSLFWVLVISFVLFNFIIKFIPFASFLRR